MADDSARKPKTDGSGPSALSLDDKGPALSLKGGGGGGRGGLRSPLAQGGGNLAPLPSGALAGGLGSPSASSSSSSSSSSPAPAGGSLSSSPKPGTSPQAAPASGQHAAVLGFARAEPRTPPREVSEIKGLSQASHHLPTETAATHVSHIMYDPGPGRSRRLLKLLLVLAVVGGIGLALYEPKRRKVAMGYLSMVEDEVLYLFDPQSKKTKPKSKSYNTANGDTRRVGLPRTATGDQPVAARRTCQQLVLDAADLGGRRLAVGDRVDLAECHLVQGDLVSAEAALRPVQTRLARATESELNTMPSSRTLADAQQVLMSTLLREGKSQEASRLIAGKCVKWAQTNTCVAKAMMLADRRLAPAGIDVMFTTQGKLDNKAQARLWLAGAQLAGVDDRKGVVDRRYDMALAAAPKQALALRKSIYEARAVDQLQRGEVGKLKATVDRAMVELKPVGAEGKVKLKMLLDLATTPDKARFVRSMLTREEMTFRVRKDIDLIELVGPESLRYGLESDYLRLLKRTKEFYSDKYQATDPVARKIAAWEIRATLSAGDGERALVLTQSYERAYNADLFSKHMRGIAYQLASTHERYQLLAAQEFQKALKLTRNWESLYALGVTMTRAGKDEVVAPIIKDLDKMTATKGQKFWTDMLKAEWYAAQGKETNALEVLNEWVRAKPQAFTPRQLLIKIYTKLNRKGDLVRAEQSLADLGRVRRQRGSTEAFASPLGPMALAKRPLE